MAKNLEDLAAVAQSQLNEQEIQANVERELKMLKFYVSQVSSFVADEDCEKLKPLLEIIVPGILNAIENLIEQMTETITRTRNSFAGCNDRVATNLENSGNLKNCQNLRENSGKF